MNENLFYVVADKNLGSGTAVLLHSGKGERKDGRVCDCRPGECRSNRAYYTGSTANSSSWVIPIANEYCSNNCSALITVEEFKRRGN